MSAQHAFEVTNTSDVFIDLFIETTTSYTAASDASNHMRQVNTANRTAGCGSGGGACKNTFGEINLKGPGKTGQISTVGLTFTFKRRDTNAEVTILWMQFSLLDFDQNSDSGDVGQECAVATGFEDYAVSDGPGVVNPTGLTTVRTVNINNGGANGVEVRGSINSGARTSPQAASPHAATPLRGSCVQQTPLRVSQGHFARRSGATAMTTRPTLMLSQTR